MIRIYEGNKPIITLSDRAYDVYSASDPLTIHLCEDGTYSMTGAYEIDGLTEDGVNELLENDYDLLFFEDDGQLYFPNDDYVDYWFGSEYPSCMTLDEIKSLAAGWCKPLAELMHQVHEATQDEINEYGK